MTGSPARHPESRHKTALRCTGAATSERAGRRPGSRCFHLGPEALPRGQLQAGFTDLHERCARIVAAELGAAPRVHCRHRSLRLPTSQTKNVRPRTRPSTQARENDSRPRDSFSTQAHVYGALPGMALPIPQLQRPGHTRTYNFGARATAAAGEYEVFSAMWLDSPAGVPRWGHKSHRRGHNRVPFHHARRTVVIRRALPVSDRPA